MLERRVLSRSQFCELMAVDEAAFRGVDEADWARHPDGGWRRTGNIVVYVENDDDATRADERDVPATGEQHGVRPEKAEKAAQAVTRQT